MNFIRKIDFTYFFIVAFLFLLQRMDQLVCVPLLNIGYAYQMSWWVFVSLLVILVSLMLFTSGDTKQNTWYFVFLLLISIGGFLDWLYIFEIPFPYMWINTNFVHFWNPFYLLFGYPWTIKEQIVWWILWIIITVLVYRYLRRKWNIKGVILE